MKTRSKRLQVSIAVSRPQQVTVTKELLRSALKRFIQTGRMPKGMKITGIVWENEPSYIKEYDDPGRFAEVLERAEGVFRLDQLDFQLRDGGS